MELFYKDGFRLRSSIIWSDMITIHYDVEFKQACTICTFSQSVRKESTNELKRYGADSPAGNVTHCSRFKRFARFEATTLLSRHCSGVVNYYRRLQMMIRWLVSFGRSHWGKGGWGWGCSLEYICCHLWNRWSITVLGRVHFNTYIKLIEVLLGFCYHILFM